MSAQFEEDKMMDAKDTIIVNQYSLASYYVEVFFNEIKLSNATCFFTKRNGTRYLITNWHVVSGKDADTMQCLNKNAAIPNKFHIYLPQKTDDNNANFDDEFIELDLYDMDGNPVWHDMKRNGQMIDIAVIPLKDNIDKYILDIEDAEEPFNENISLRIADEIYVIGFPFGRIGGMLPIWKKASVASEPSLDLNDMPYFFADTATRSGMSGSPVILYEKRPVVIAESLHGKFSKYRTKLVGIYSGRIGADTENKNDAQLGRVWKAEMLDKIISTFEK